MNDKELLFIALSAVGVSLWIDWRKQEAERKYRERSWWSKFRGIK